MMRRKISIAGREISEGNKPYIIAEMSANHNGSIDAAFKIIEMAKSAGADAVKIQTYRADTITIRSDLPDFQITDGLWAGKSLYDLYEWAHTPWEWHEALFEHARSVGITIFSTPFDRTAVDLLEELGAPAYKIASFEAVDLDLIKYVAKTGKPMIISTGMADLEETQEAIAAARAGGCEELAILHCVSGYPAPAKDYNLRTLSDMVSRFGLVTGLSDHTLDNTTAIASVALGVSIIEKHVTLDRDGGGPDDSFSLESEGLEQLCSGSQTAWEALGVIDYGRKSSELGNTKFRRSLYVVEDIPAGGLLTKENIRSIRPGFGMAPRHFEQCLGKRAARDIARGTALSAEMLSD